MQTKKGELTMFKKIIGFLCSVIFCTTIAVGMPQMARAAEEIAINETNFPDEIFREYVISEFDKDKNNKLSEDEIIGITTISISGKGIKNLKGIEYFTFLTDLTCSANQLTFLDLSQNTALEYLNCCSAQLTALDLSQNTELIHLECGSNQLMSIDLSQNTVLTYLYCPYNQLTDLDLNQNMALTYLNCGSNQLTTLNLSQNTALTYLNCDSNQLTTLNLNQNRALTNLCCSSNQLITLDLSQNTALTDLSCGWNQLTDLNISQNTVLTNLYCKWNQLITLDVSQNIALTNLECENNQLTALDVSNNQNLTLLRCDSTQLTALDLSNNIILTDLYCESNQLTTLDLSNNPALIRLGCDSNQLTSLDLSNNMGLITLYCKNNQLTALDLSNNPALTYLYCSDNQLTELKLHSQTYDKLLLYKYNIHGSDVSLSDLKNVTETDIIKVIDITKSATYKANGKDFTIIYVDKEIAPSASPSAVPSPVPSSIPTPSASPVISTNNHIFIDYNYNIPVSGSAIIYGNGISKTVDSKKVNNKVFTAYTDITASYKYTVNSKDIVKPAVGKVIVGVTKSDIKPEVSSRNKITDTSASNIAKARIKNGQITVTSVGKEGGLVYLWVIDTGNKGVSACCPINVKLAPKKLEVQDTSGSKLKDTKLANGNTLEVCIAGLAGSIKTDDCTYTATVDQKYSSYITVTPVQDSKNKFTIKATGLKNNKDTKVSITFTCDQNGKKTKFALTITK